MNGTVYLVVKSPLYHKQKGLSVIDKYILILWSDRKDQLVCGCDDFLFSYFIRVYDNIYKRSYPFFTNKAFIGL